MLVVPVESSNDVCWLVVIVRDISAPVIPQPAEDLCEFSGVMMMIGNRKNEIVRSPWHVAASRMIVMTRAFND